MAAATPKPADLLAKKAAKAISKEKYTKFIDALVALGEHLEQNRHETTSIVIPNSLALKAFLTAWEDASLEKQDHHLKPKKQLNQSTRDRIKAGLKALTIGQGDIKATDASTAVKYNTAATKAILEYKTPRQKILNLIGLGLTALVGLTAGITTAAAVLLSLPINAPVIALSAVIGIAGGIVNWMIFEQAVYTFLNDIAGKDRPFEGLTHFIQDGKKVELSRARKIVLVVSILLATSVGAATAALTYSSIVGLAAFVPAAIAVTLLPISVVLSTIAFVCMSALMIRSFANMIKSKDLKSTFTKPFIDVANVFDPEMPQNKNKSSLRLAIEKGVTYSLVAILTGFALFGLTMMSYASTQSLTGFLTSVLNLAPKIANYVSYTVSMGAALVGQIPFIVESSAKTIAVFATYFRNLFAPRTTQETRDKPSESLIRRALTSLMSIINAVGNGILLLPSLLMHGQRIAISSASAAFFNSLSAAVSSSTENEKPDDRIKAAASTARVSKILGVLPSKITVAKPIEAAQTITTNESTNENRHTTNQPRYTRSA